MGGSQFLQTERKELLGVRERSYTRSGELHSGPRHPGNILPKDSRDPLHIGQTLFFNTSGQGTPNSFPIDSFDSVEKVMGWEFMGVLGMFVPRFCRSSIRLIQMQSRYKNIRQQKDQLILIQFQKVSKPVQVPLAFRLLTSPRIHPRRPQICWGTLVNFTCKSVVEILQALLQEGFSSFHQEGNDFFQFTTQPGSQGRDYQSSFTPQVLQVKTIVPIPSIRTSD